MLFKVTVSQSDLSLIYSKAKILKNYIYQKKFLIPCKNTQKNPKSVHSAPKISTNGKKTVQHRDSDQK